MVEVFSQEQIEMGWNHIIIEEDGVEFIGEQLAGEGKEYTLTGTAIIEGETYHDFQIMFQLEQEPDAETIEAVMACDWEWYDYPM